MSPHETIRLQREAEISGAGFGFAICPVRGCGGCHGVVQSGAQKGTKGPRIHKAPELVMIRPVIPTTPPPPPPPQMVQKQQATEQDDGERSGHRAGKSRRRRNRRPRSETNIQGNGAAGRVLGWGEGTRGSSAGRAVEEGRGQRAIVSETYFGQVQGDIGRGSPTKPP